MPVPRTKRLVERPNFSLCTVARLYARASDDRRQDGASVTMQLQQCQAWCQSKQLTILDEYIDNDVSGVVLPLAARPQGARLLADTLQSGQPMELIVVWKLSRFGRDDTDTRVQVDALLKAKRLLVSVTEPMDATTPHGRFMLGIHSTVSAQEADHIREYTSNGRVRAARKDRWLGGTLPYGYQGKEKYVIIPSDRVVPQLGITEAALVKLCVQKVIDGRSATAVAAWLNQLGVKVLTYTTLNQPLKRHTPACKAARAVGEGELHCGCPVRESPWYARQIVSFCTNTTYAGDATMETLDGEGVLCVIPRTAPVLVPREMQLAAQARLREYRSYRKNMDRGRNYLLRGLVICDAVRSDGQRCGRRLAGHGGNASGAKHYYKCPHAAGGKAFLSDGVTCPGPYIAAPWLEDRVWEAALDFLEKRELVLDQVRMQLAQPPPDGTASRLAAIPRRLQTIDAMVARAKLLVLDASSGLTVDDFKEQLAQLRAERTTLLTEQQTLTQAQAATTAQADTLATIEALLTRAQTALDQLTDYRATDTRREMLRILQTQVHMAPLAPVERHTRAAITIRFFVNCTSDAVFVFANRTENSPSETDKEAGMLTVVEHVYVSEELNRPPHRPVGERRAAILQFWDDYYRRYPGGKGAVGPKPIFDEAQSLALLYEHEAGASLPALARKYGVDRKQIWKAVHRGLYLRARAEEDA
jgi:DNA invertase Pin-like site-specific DNA recombinase